MPVWSDHSISSRYMYPLVSPRGANVRDEDISEDMRFGSESLDYLKFTIYDPGKSSPYNYVGTQGGGTGGKFQGNKFADEAIYSSIYLYLPHELRETYGVSYNKATLGPFGDALTTAMSGGDSEGLAEAISQGAASATPQATFSAVSGMFNNVPLIDTELNKDQLAGLVKQKVFNPYQETVFEGTNYRSHTFDFDMAPRNESEAREIRNIISVLRDSMLPGTSGATNRWLTIPRFFKTSIVRYQPGNTKTQKLNEPAQLSYIMQFPVKMVLSNMDVNLTPSGQNTSIKDTVGGNRDIDYGPASYKLSLKFDETAFLTRNLLKGGTGYGVQDMSKDDDFSFMNSAQDRARELDSGEEATD
tara:strand:- start:962 stop:2038 length:1077 start_codon:yes stop_codon:yes gene_type:complete